MLIDAAHPEETRVAVVTDGQIEDFDFEAREKRQLRGNIYLAKVTRVEPSLQAAFVEYGGNRHGFLAFSEIHPDYYQIPQEDREALLAEEEEYAASQRADDDPEDDEDHDTEEHEDDNQSEDEPYSSSTDEHTDGELVETSDHETDSSEETSDETEHSQAHKAEAINPLPVLPIDDTEDPNDEDDSEDDVSSQDEGEDEGDDDEDDDDNTDDAVAERPKRRIPPNRRYKIQEVIKRRQVLLIQVVKEERGNKGAAVTTYLSLAGRYGVLMPNTARGGGISRKITNASDRKRIKKITKDFDVPRGMGLIIRTAGAKRTKAEISRDYDYLMRLWNDIRQKTLKSVAPCLIHEEGDLVLRAVRDLYDRDVETIHVEGDQAYSQARNVISMLMPEHENKVVKHSRNTPVFISHGVEPQLDNIFSPTVTLRSGGYIVINQTEALVAIDVNSGKATRERNIETTALKTNLEAAEETCRQMRLRDLAGLIVIDFIDMEENKNNRAVEKRMKECLSIDRARVQAGRISQFGLFEISRQRRRAGVLELSSEPCSVCSGTGRTRSIESAALQLLRSIGERAADERVGQIDVKAPGEVALYVLNKKRDEISRLEDSEKLAIHILSDDSLMPGDFDIEATNRDGKTVPYKPIMPDAENNRKGRRRRSDRQNASDQNALAVVDDIDDNETEDDTIADEDDNSQRRRRGRRGGRRRRGSEDDNNLGVIDTDHTQSPEGNGRNKRHKRKRQRKRTPDVALDGGEMFDVIATAPFIAMDPVSTSEDLEQTDPTDEKQSNTEHHSSDTPQMDSLSIVDEQAESPEKIERDDIKSPADASDLSFDNEPAKTSLDSDAVLSASAEADELYVAPNEEVVQEVSDEPHNLASSEIHIQAEEDSDQTIPDEDSDQDAASLHQLHAATPSPEPTQRRRFGWWNRGS